MKTRICTNRTGGSSAWAPRRPWAAMGFMAILAALVSNACVATGPAEIVPPSEAAPTSTPVNIPIADGFDFPVGRTGTVTEAKDRDSWYNAQDFTVNDHL